MEKVRWILVVNDSKFLEKKKKMSKNNNDCHQQPKHLLVKLRIIQQEKKQ